MLDRALWHMIRALSEFWEDVEVEAMEIWDNIKELFQREEL